MATSSVSRILRYASIGALSLGCFLPQLASAASYLSNVANFKDGEWVIQGGGFYAEMGKAQHIDINGAVGNNFNVADKKSYNALVGAGYYLKPTSVANHTAQYGINAFFIHNTNVGGTITQEDLFTNLGYGYQVNHLPIYAMLKMPNVFASRVSADVGIGPNVMFLGRVKERSLDGGVTIPDNAFGSRTNVTFSATAGLNVQVMQNAMHPIHCGYRFFYLGEGRFKKSTNQLLDNLNTGQTYGNAIMCSMLV